MLKHSIHKKNLDNDSEAFNYLAREIYTNFADVLNDYEKVHLPEFIKGIKYLTPETLGYVFDYTFTSVTDKNRVIDKIYLLASHKSNLLRAGAAATIGNEFRKMPDKQKILEILHNLTFDKNSSVLYFVINSLEDIYQYMPDNYKISSLRDLNRLVYNDKEFIREETAFAYSRIAEYYKLKSDFESVYECYHNSSIAYFIYEGNFLKHFLYLYSSWNSYLHKRDFEYANEFYLNSLSAYRKMFSKGKLNIKPIFYLYYSMSLYYLGRNFINDFMALPYNPKKSKVILKKAVKCFEYAVGYANTYVKIPPTENDRTISTQTETRLYPICYGIYSIYLDYFSIRLDIGKKKLILIRLRRKFQKYKRNANY